MPTWANNPDYTLHATTTKPDESQRKPVFEIFDGKSDRSHEPEVTPAPRSSSESDAKKDKKPTTQL
jgi:hypothetical protein